MTIEQVKMVVKQIEGEMGDNEAAHGDEDRLYVAVLEAIADGSPDAQELAKEALKANKLEYDRWYA